MDQNSDRTDYRLKMDPTVIGSTGLRQSGGFVYEEILRDLAGIKGARTYREMADNDAVVGAVLYAVTMLIRQCKWTVQAVDDSEEAKLAEEFVEEVLFRDMSSSFSDVIAEVCSMFVYGFAPLEIVWKRRGGPDAPDGTSRSISKDGRIGIRSLAIRAQTTVTRWLIDQKDGGINGLVQQPLNGTAVTIPIEKMLLFRTVSSRNNPEGRSVLRTAYRSWKMKKRIEEIEGIGIERDLAGLPVGYIPGEYFSPDVDAQQAATLAAWQKMVTRVRRDQQEGLLLPSDRDASGNLTFDFKLLSTGGTRSFDTSKVIDRYNRAIGMSALADFIFLGQSSVGSFALSSDKTALFATAVGAYLTSIAETFNRHLLSRLWKLNGLEASMMPTLVAGDLEKQNLAEVATFVQSLAQAGAPLFPDRDLENHLRTLAGFPPAPEEGASGDEPTSIKDPTSTEDDAGDQTEDAPAE